MTAVEFISKRYRPKMCISAGGVIVKLQTLAVCKYSVPVKAFEQALYHVKYMHECIYSSSVWVQFYRLNSLLLIDLAINPALGLSLILQSHNY